MSLLFALLPTLTQYPSHLFSYHHPLLLTSLATLTAIIYPGTPTNQAKICLIGSFPLIFYRLTTPNITPYYTMPSHSLVPARIASKCTWKTLPDLSSNHLPISITIPTSPLINSIHCLLPLTLQHSLFLKPPTPLPNSSMILPLLPFLLAASTVLLKHGGLLKSQMPSRNAERHLQRHTFLSKKTVRTISLSVDIPPL